MTDTASNLSSATAPRLEYVPADPAAALGPDVLAAVTFGGSPGTHADPRYLRVGLEPLQSVKVMELWRASGPVQSAVDGAIRYSADAHYLFGIVELDERELGGIAGAAETAYTAIRRFAQGSAHPHLLRVWNHFDDINGGEGDQERYRQFCIGRAAGLSDWHRHPYPAATAIGRQGGDPTLQVYWLAAREPGVALENPRQVNPWSYPRSYGPVPPQFSRAMRVGENLVLISGTASIVGYESHHALDLAAQLNESLANLESVLARAGATAPRVHGRIGSKGLLKVYLRDATAAAIVEAQLNKRRPSMPHLLLAGDICRRDLLVEVECVQGGS